MNRHLLLRTLTLARTSHGFIVLIGLLVGGCYFPAWFGYLFSRALAGAVSWLLIATMLIFVGVDLWQCRSALKKYIVSEEDRLIGHALIISGVLIYPFCRFALWPQALTWLIIIMGIVTSSCGLVFFRQHRLSTVFLALTVYPRLGILSRTAWEFFFPPNALEKFMAQIASVALQGIGLEALADGRFIAFPQGKVEVGWGCNGLDMAITVAIAGLFIGLIFKQTFPEIMKFMAIGIAMALVANIPRLMLVSVAYVYWGKDWFRFWHGFWGGQVFSAILFTIYYYLIEFSSRSNQPSA